MGEKKKPINRLFYFFFRVSCPFCPRFLLFINIGTKKKMVGKITKRLLLLYILLGSIFLPGHHFIIFLRPRFLCAIQEQIFLNRIFFSFLSNLFFRLVTRRWIKKLASKSEFLFLFSKMNSFEPWIFCFSTNIFLGLVRRRWMRKWFFDSKKFFLLSMRNSVTYCFTRTHLSHVFTFVL